MNYSEISQRLTFANVVAVIALFVALGGAGYAASKINGKAIKKQTIAGSKLKAETLDGSRINESTLGTVPSAAQADTAGSANTAGSADTATTAETAANANQAQNAATVGGQSAAQLAAAGSSGNGNASCNPNVNNNAQQNVICASTSLNLQATSDVYLIGSGSWYGQGAGPDKGECYVSRDPSVNTLSQRQTVGQVDAEHTDFDTAGEVVAHTVVQDVPPGNQTFRFRCFEEDGDFKVEVASITAVRLPS